MSDTQQESPAGDAERRFRSALLSLARLDHTRLETALAEIAHVARDIQVKGGSAERTYLLTGRKTNAGEPG